MPRARRKSSKRKSKKRTKSKTLKSVHKKTNAFYTPAELQGMSTKDVQRYRDRAVHLLTFPPSFVYKGKEGADFYYNLTLAQSHALKELMRRRS